MAVHVEDAAAGQEAGGDRADDRPGTGIDQMIGVLGAACVSLMDLRSVWSVHGGAGGVVGSGWTRRLMPPEHRIGQRDRSHVAGVRIGQDVGIDKKHHAHFGAFACCQMLLAKAEHCSLSK